MYKRIFNKISVTKMIKNKRNITCLDKILKIKN